MKATISEQQVHVLQHLYRLQVQQQHSGLCLKWGVPWHTKASRSEQASLSRTLARLEARGLVLRQNQRTGNNAVMKPDPNGTLSSGSVRAPGDARVPKSRTTSVLLLPAGIAIVERLTRPVTGDVNRQGREAA